MFHCRNQRQHLGDEVCDAFYLCPTRNVHTICTWRDDFTGLESRNTNGPITRAEGDKSGGLIETCSTPWDSTCRCAADVTYFRGALD